MITYNVPAHLLDAYKDEQVIVRSDDPRELARCVEHVSAVNLQGLELRSLSSDPTPLLYVQEPVPIDLVPEDGWREGGELLKFIALQRDHFVQVFVPLSPGVSEVAKKVASLGFPLRLQIGSLDRFPVEETLDLLRYYLHDESVKTPIEFFQSMSRIFYDTLLDPETAPDETMWLIMEEYPEFFRYVTDEGKMVLSRRLPDIDASGLMEDFFDNLELQLLAERGECSRCAFFTNCAGYFKLPDQTFKCNGVKRIFESLKEEITLLRVDLEENKTPR
jgi:hypothetical protein